MQTLGGVSLVTGGTYKLSPTYTFYKVGSNYYAEDEDGNIDYSGSNASTVIQAAFNAMLAAGGGQAFFRKGIYDLPTVISVVGAGAPSLGADLSLTTLEIKGEGRWATIFRKTGAAGNMFEFSNAASVKMSDCYLYQAGINGYPIRGLSTGASERCLMRSEFRNIEIHGVNAGYYGIYIQNAYFINDWDLIYIRSSGGGILAESTATGYGNQHFTNIYISLAAANGIGVYLRNNGANYGECSFDRLHVDGGDLDSTIGIQLYGSNYNKFYYIKLEHCGIGIYIEAGATSAMNEFTGGYNYCRVNLFNFNTTNSRGNLVKNISCHSRAAGCLLLTDACNGTNEPDIFEDLHGYTTNFSATPVTRGAANTCLLRGVILASKGETSGTATILNGQTSVTVTHDLILTPEWVTVEGSTADTDETYVTALGATTFVINVPVAVGADRTVYWRAGVNKN